MSRPPNPLPHETWPERRIREELRAQSGEITAELGLSLDAIAAAARDNVATSDGIASAIEASSSAMESSIHSLQDQIVSTTEVIEASISELGDGIVAAVNDGADRVSAAVSKVGALIATSAAIAMYQREVTNALLGQIARAVQNPRATAAEEYIRQAEALLFADRNLFGQQAHACLERAISEDPTSFSALFLLAELSFGRDQFEEGVSFITQAILLSSDNKQRRLALRTRALRLRAKGAYESALQDADELVNIRADADALYLNGQLSALCGDVAGGLSLIRKSINIDKQMYAVAAMDPSLRFCEKELIAVLHRLNMEIQQDISLATSRVLSTVEIRNSVARYFGARLVDDAGRTNVTNIVSGNATYDTLCREPARLGMEQGEIWREIETMSDIGFSRLIATLEREIRIEKRNAESAQRDQMDHEDAIARFHREREEMTPHFLRVVLGMRTPPEDPPPYLVADLERAKTSYWSAHTKLHQLDQELLLVQYVLRRAVVKVADRSLLVDDFERWRTRS